MFTRNRIFIAILLVILPVLIRVLYFYQAPYQNENIQVPDYTLYAIPAPPTPSSQIKTAPGVATGKVILIDRIHSNMFDPSEIEPLMTAINTRGANVEFTGAAKSLDLQLKYASAYIVIAPSYAFNDYELQIIRQFVTNGGRLLVFADPTRATLGFDSSGNIASLPDVNYINPLIASYGLTMINDYLYNMESNEGNFRNVQFTTFTDHNLTKDLQMVVFYGTHSIRAENGTALTGPEPQTFSSLTDHSNGLSPLALSANGQILAAGDVNFLTNPFNQVADNALLLAHIADFLVDGERNPTLANFPFIFQRPVSLLVTGEVELSADLLEPMASLQRSLQFIDIPVNIRQEVVNNTDTIVLGTFNSLQDLEPYLEPFNLDPQKQAYTLDISALGQPGNTNIGILLFNRGPKSNTLVLLASNLSDLPNLIKLVASGDISTCVLQDNIAACKLAPLEDSGSYDYYSDPVEPPTEIPVFTETPTPSG